MAQQQRVTVSDVRRIPCGWKAFALSCLLSLPVQAHEDEDPLEEVLVEGRRQSLVGEAIAASQGVIGQAEIKNRPLLRTGEVLEAIPGVVVTQHSGSGKANQLFLRGFNLDHGTDFATFIDGMPINMPTHGHGQGYTDLNFMIPELIRSVEYRKGPYFLEVGDFSGAGAAEFKTADTLPEGLVKAGTGFDGFERLLVANTVDTGGGKLLFGLESHRYDGPWDQIAEDLGRYVGTARYTHDLAGGNLALTAMAYDAEWDSADQIPERAVRSGLITELGSIDTTVGGETSRFSLSAQWRRESEDRRLRANVYAIDYELDLFSNFTYFLDDPVNGDQFEQVDDRRILGAGFAHTWLADGPGGHMHHTLGVGLRHDDIDEVALYRTNARRRLGTVRSDRVTETSAGIYYENDAKWGERLRSIAGVRVDRYDFDVDANLDANSGEANETIVSPKFTASYAVNADMDLYASAGRGFHSNDARGVTIAIDPVSGQATEGVDPLVRSQGAEVGMRFAWRDELNSSASLWYLELDSELLFVGDAGNTEASRPSRRYGVEFANYYRANDIWTFDLDLTLSESEFDDGLAGNRIPGTLERTIAAGANADFGNGFNLNLRLRHFGGRPLIEDGSVEAGSVSVANLRLGYQRERLNLAVDVLNLFDSDDRDIDYFYASRLPGEPAEGVEEIHYHPIEPRTLRAFVSWSFGARSP